MLSRAPKLSVVPVRVRAVEHEVSRDISRRYDSGAGSTFAAIEISYADEMGWTINLDDRSDEGCPSSCSDAGSRGTRTTRSRRNAPTRTVVGKMINTPVPAHTRSSFVEKSLPQTRRGCGTLDATRAAMLPLLEPETSRETPSSRPGAGLYPSTSELQSRLTSGQIGISNNQSSVRNAWVKALNGVEPPVPAVICLCHSPKASPCGCSTSLQYQGQRRQTKPGQAEQWSNQNSSHICSHSRRETAGLTGKSRISHSPLTT